MSEPAPLLQLPHRIDRRLFAEQYQRLPLFLQSVEKVRDRELANGNGAFFHILAEQWRMLASVQYLFQHEPAEVIRSARHWLDEVTFGLDLGHALEPEQVLECFFAALALHDRSFAHHLASAPEDLLGLYNDPDSLPPVFIRLAFALHREQAAEVETELGVLEELLAEEPPADVPAASWAEMGNLYQLFASIRRNDASSLDLRLNERCSLRSQRMEEEFDENTPSLIDWTALGLVRQALERGLEVAFRHVSVPRQFLEAADQTRQ